MKSTQTMSALLLGVMVLSPIVSFAQTETSAGATTGTSAARDIKSPRDAASGQASGKRMVNASGTVKIVASTSRPLPAGMEKRMEDRDDVRAKMMQNSSSTAGRGAEMREKMAERRGEILKRITNQMILRMNAAIERLAKLADRIDSRIVKLKEKGVDTAKAEANIAIARTKIADAKAAVAAAGNGVESASIQADASASSTKPSDPGKTVREALTQARTAVFAAHKAIVDALTSLKAGVGVGMKATSTASTRHGSTTTTSGVGSTN
jgi:hypothetical protein